MWNTTSAPSITEKTKIKIKIKILLEIT